MRSTLVCARVKLYRWLSLCLSLHSRDILRSRGTLNRPLTFLHLYSLLLFQHLSCPVIFLFYFLFFSFFFFAPTFPLYDYRSSQGTIAIIFFGYFTRLDHHCFESIQIFDSVSLKRIKKGELNFFNFRGRLQTFLRNYSYLEPIVNEWIYRVKHFENSRAWYSLWRRHVARLTRLPFQTCIKLRGQGASLITRSVCVLSTVTGGSKIILIFDKYR